MVDLLELCACGNSRLSSLQDFAFPRPTPSKNPIGDPLPLVGFPNPVSRRRSCCRAVRCRALDAPKAVDSQVFSVTSTSKSDVDYLGESTKGDLNVRQEHLEAFALDDQLMLDGPIEEIAEVEAKRAEDSLKELGIAV